MAKPMFIVLNDEQCPGKFAIAERDIDGPTYLVICRGIDTDITAEHMLKAFEAYSKKERKASGEDWRF